MNTIKVKVLKDYISSSHKKAGSYVNIKESDYKLFLKNGLIEKIEEDKEINKKEVDKELPKKVNKQKKTISADKGD